MNIESLDEVIDLRSSLKWIRHAKNRALFMAGMPNDSDLRLVGLSDISDSNLSKSQLKTIGRIIASFLEDNEQEVLEELRVLGVKTSAHNVSEESTNSKPF